MVRRKHLFTRQEMGFLDAIHTNPRDDAPRLIYADWLDEIGKPELSEFIRLQCARTNPGLRGYFAGDGRTEREEFLEKTFGSSWYRPLPRGTILRCFLRGLPLITFRTTSFTAADMDYSLQRVSPLARFELCLSGYSSEDENGALVRGFEERLNHPIMSRTSSLIVLRQDATEANIQSIRTCPFLPRIERIIFAAMSEEVRLLCKDFLAPIVPVHIKDSKGISVLNM